MNTYETTKDPDSALSYIINWASADGTNDGGPNDTGWLQGDTIVASTWTVPDDITVDDDSFTAKTTKVVLSSGVADAIYVCTNHITTAAGLEEDAVLVVKILPAQSEPVITAVGYATVAEADVVLAHSNTWATATTNQKTSALSWSRVYLDQTYSMAQIDQAAPPAALKQAAAILADEHLRTSLFARQSTEAPISQKDVSAGSASISKTYDVSKMSRWVDPFPMVTALLYGTCELQLGSSVATRGIMRA